VIFERNTIDQSDLDFKEYVKHGTTRVAGPIDSNFTVVTVHGPVEAAAGSYVAIDAKGWPYPIAAAEFDAIYAGEPDRQWPAKWREAGERDWHLSTAVVRDGKVVVDIIPPDDDTWDSISIVIGEVE
jgi:hypothetical protein